MNGIYLLTSTATSSILHGVEQINTWTSVHSLHLSPTVIAVMRTTTAGGVIIGVRHLAQALAVSRETSRHLDTTQGDMVDVIQSLVIQVTAPSL